MMHVLVYGANGWIGGQLVELLQNKKIPHTIGNSRLDNVDAVEEDGEW